MTIFLKEMETLKFVYYFNYWRPPQLALEDAILNLARYDNSVHVKSYLLIASRTPKVRDDASTERVTMELAPRPQSHITSTLTLARKFGKSRAKTTSYHGMIVVISGLAVQAIVILLNECR